MRENFRNIYSKLRFFLVFILCFYGVSYLAIAATDSIQVRQTVGEEGNGEEPEEGGSGGFVLPMDATPPEITDMRIFDINLHGAEISFRTDEICLVELYYGRSQGYGSGPLYDHADSYMEEHRFSLKDLDAGAKYYLKIVIKNQKGVINTVTSYDFYTIPEFSQAVPDVGSLRAIQEGKTVVLEWKNPEVENFQGVQINRQTGSFALSPDQGEKIFFGSAARFVDADVRDGMKYYYTIFAFDTGGQFSSGAAVAIRVRYPSAGSGEDGSGSSSSENPPTDDTSSFVKDVRNLQADVNIDNKTITLSWEYPEIENASEVEIRRDVNFPPMSPLEGSSAYAGADTSFVDKDLKKGQTYFYTVFVKSKTGVYSSGKVIASELKESASGPVSSDQWGDMSFVDVASGIMLGAQGESLHVQQYSILGINYGVDALPDNLAAVAAQIGDSSYFLTYSEESHSFKTSFTVPSVPGEYDVDIVFLNADSEVFFEKDIKLKVLPKGQIYAYRKEGVFDAGMTWDRILCRLGNFFGGDNHACMSKVTVGGVEIRMFKKNQDGIWEFWNAKEVNRDNPFWTDDSGQYGFCLPNGEYEINVQKEGFRDGKSQFSVTDNILSQDVQIYSAKEYRYLAFLLLIFVIWILNRLRRKILDRNK